MYFFSLLCNWQNRRTDGTSRPFSMDLWHLLSADRWKIYLNREISFKNTCQVCVAIKTKTEAGIGEKRMLTKK